MKTGSITFKLLALVISAFVLTTITVLVIANDRLIQIIDQSQNTLYNEKINVLWNLLDQTEERLRKTGWIEAYSEDFQESAVKTIRNNYYDSLDQSIYPFILDLNGRVVLHPVLPAGDESLMSCKGISQMTQMRRGNFIGKCDGQKKWCVYRRFNAWGWVIAYAVPLDVKYADARSFRLALLGVMAGVNLLILLLLSGVLARFIKPIVTLTHLSSQIASGNLNQKIDLSGKDEVGTLARSFDHMRDSIKQQIDELSYEIEERRQTEIRLMRSKENLRVTLHSICDAVIATDTEGIIVRMNPVAEKLSGWSFSEAEGKPLKQVLHLIDAETRAPIRNPSESIASPGKSAELPENSILIARDGTEYRISDSGAPIFTDTGDLLGMVMVFRDVTAEYALQENLKQSQKMDAIGQLAGGVAHDFNNMLGGILGAAELLKDYLPQEPAARQFHSVIVDSANRAAGLTQKLLTFARKRPATFAALDVHAVLQEVVALMKSTIDPRIEVVMDMAARTSVVEGEPSLLQSALLNLGINASHAMPHGGTIQIRSANVKLDAAACSASPFEVAPGSYLEIEVSDTGSGIAAKDLPHLFEPFFTTKQQGQGTGLGLASVFGTVQQHRGLVEAVNRPEGGAIFRVLLPLSTAVLDPVLPPVAHEVKGAGTILVVDDERAIRMTVKANLQHLGYTVLLAEDGQQALDLFSADPSAIDLVLLDMIMPKMNGRDCFEALQKINPDVRVILASGYAPEKDIEQMNAAGLQGFLIKPYAIPDLSQLIHTALS